MGCCDDIKPVDTSTAQRRGVDRRTVIKGIIGAIAGVSLGAGHLGFAQEGGRQVRLAFCSQLLCVVPYEFTRAKGFFAAEGLAVELIYTRGGNAAMQALVGGAVEYAATSFDVALAAFANGAEIQRFATTGRLPLFALVTAPDQAAEITEIGALEGKTVGVSALGNSDHALLLYLLDFVGADADKVRFATLGTNLYEAVRLGRVDAGMVQEPALSLLQEDGARVLMNAMNLEDAEKYLGGPYEFMGVSVRAAEREERLEEMQALGRALENGLRELQIADISDIVDALPDELIVGGNLAQLEEILATYRASLYPEVVEINVEACRRVQQAHLAAGMLEQPVDLDALLATEVLGEYPDVPGD